MKKHPEDVLPKPVKISSRNCFGVEYYLSEADAVLVGTVVEARGDRYNGGIMHSAPCGRDASFDFVSDEFGQLFGVTVA